MNPYDKRNVDLTTLTTSFETAVRLFTASNTGTSIAVPADSIGDPTLDGSSGIIARPKGGNGLMFDLFGTNADNERFDWAWIGWWPGTTSGTWIKRMIAHYSATLGATVGIDNGIVTASEFYADTIVQDGGLDSAQVYSPISDGKAWVLLDTLGAWYVQGVVDVGVDSPNALGGNALVTWL